MAKGKQKPTEKLDLLTAVENVVELAHDSGLAPEFFRKADTYICYLAARLDLTKEQSLMMALFLDNSGDRAIELRDLAKFVGCSTTRILKYVKDINVLVQKDMVRSRGCGAYRVPWYVIEPFTRNEKFEGYSNANISCEDFFGVLSDIFSIREENEIESEVAVTRLKTLMDENRQLAFVQQVKSYNLDDDDEALLLLFAHLFIDDNDDHIRFYDLEFLFNDTRRKQNRIKSRLNNGSHPLLEMGIIEYSNNDGLADRESFHITDDAKRLLFCEMKNIALRPENRRNVLRCDKIVPKQLYYDKKIEAQIDELANLLDDNRYRQIRTRMEEMKYHSGFACLFYGAPGTGKTETALQLARRTGRDIIQVNIPEIKSCWVGESEKNIKRLFDDYRSKVKNSKLAPILLFNEADAVIGIRQKGAQGAVDKMENSIQNIILQEMETLDGIMIATTNLAQNLDKAFERRFLYKIKFDKPTIEARMSIWREMIPALTEDEARTLSTKYEFSGGQIENIARRNAIGTILHGNEASTLDTLIAYCNDERLDTKNQKRIGF